ncbi:hypothetical protein LB467_00640 [Salegentibacter sp. JZCK2]|uniref:hypothetical protein n=1 Tax=Salegentibacter tibetensis TaxID=2873600 RepID=UPI001CCA1224|nr:hypothetical protein [Salegentibacter tibetensis]MBZ9728181.1 hypothetical protein [Salegentibacter tibetensis]
MKIILQSIIPLFLIIAVSSGVNSQSTKENLIEKLSNYKVVKKEIAYLHLNKSLLLKGEQLGFAAYVLNESTHKPNISNSNLYVTVKNEKDSLIKKEMYRVEDGNTFGVIDIDSTFQAGNYTLTAFTNQMQNFEEPYHFSESFKILNSSYVAQEPRGFPDKIDIQFLPESGHYLNNTINSVGVIATDSLGLGIGNAKIIIKNSSEELIGIVELNDFGIGKFSFIPNRNENYTAIFKYGGEELPVEFSPEIEYKGIVLSVNEKKTQLEILLKTNANSLSLFQSKKFFLIAQGSETFQSFNIEFKDHKTALVVFDLKELAPGMNVFTLFNEKMQPIAERLYFNHENFVVETSRNLHTTSKKDSLHISIPFGAQKEGKLSISILPENTISYQRNHNILSYINLKPYIKGNIENAARYFTNVTPERKRDLDNLLLTQGWSSYNWKNIFENNLQLSYNQHKFSFKAYIPTNDVNQKKLSYLIHGVGVNAPQVIEIPEGFTSFVFDEYVPVKGEKLKISRIKSNENLVPANLNIRFLPNKFPDFESQTKPLPLRILSQAENQTQQFNMYEGLNTEAELLNEVHLSAKVERPVDRARKLGKHRFGRVSVISEQDINLFHYLADFLKSQALNVNDSPNFWVTSNFATNTSTRERDSEDPDFGMSMYLDDVPMADKGMFYNFPLTQVDYVEINKTGMGAGFRDSRGSIKVYTKHDSHFSSKSFDRIQEIDIPLAYAEEKQYYVPRYENTSDEFFQKFGVIDWIPKVSFEKGEAAVITIKKPEVGFQLIIEGVTSEGDLIHDVQQLSADSI